MACHLLLLGSSGVPHLAERYSKLLIELAKPLHRTVIIDWMLVPAATQLGDDPLRFPKRIGADKHRPRWIGMQSVKQSVDLAARVGMAEDGEPERRFGDEDVAGHGHETWAGRIRATLVIARNDDPLARMSLPGAG